MLRLTIELVPSTQWQDNLRSRLPRVRWDALRKACYAAADHRCEICGGRGTRHPVECHERWSFDEATSTQTLVGLIALCPRCHEVKHFGLALSRGFELRALEHFARTNNLDAVAACDAVEHAFEIWATRSKRAWKLDLAWLEARTHAS